MGSGSHTSGHGAVAAAGPEPSSWRGRALSWPLPRRALGWVLVVAWIAWVIALWVVQPRLVAQATLDDDLAAGRVTGYRVVTVGHHDPGLFTPAFRLDIEAAPMPTSSAPTDAEPTDTGSSDGSTDQDGRPLTVGYWVDAPVASFRVLDTNGLSSDGPAAEVQRLTDAGVPASHDPGFFSPPWNTVHNAGGLLLFLTFLLIVFGPRPARGTRWFWFWLLPGPLLVAVPGYAALELLRPRADADAAVHPPGRAGRWSGLVGFLLGFLVWALLTAALTTLGQWWPLWVVRG